MTQNEILKLAIEMGIDSDLRGRERVLKYLARQKDKYECLPQKKKKEFDLIRLESPYLDSGVWNDNGQPVKKAMAGIDVSSGEILLAKDLGFDTIINHHPIGKGLAMIEQAMDLQVDVLADYGVPVNIAESLFKPRISEVARGVHASNHYEIVDTARLAGINLMNIHTPADNLVASYLKKKVEEKKPEYVGEITDILNDIEEYEESGKRGICVKMFAGSEENRAGRIAFSEITGGTQGSKDIYKHLSTAGIGTVVAMHLSEEHRRNAEEAHLNVIVAPHIASDSLGMNLFLDEIEKKGIEIIPFGGLIRVKRN